MNIIESLRKVESRIFADRNESVNLVDMYLTNSKNIDKAKLQEMLENNNTNGVIKLLNKANKKSLKEDYYTVKYYYYTDDNQIEEDGHTFDNAQDAKAFSDSVKSGLKNNLIRLDWDIHDENTTRDWELLDRKTITDFDGFNTEYSLWKKIDEDYWVCVFGDSDIYGPEDGEFDAEFDTEREAQEWFDNYNGFEDELDENLSLKEGKRNGKFQTVYWLVTRGTFIHGPRRDYDYGVNDDSELFWYNIEDGYKTLSSAKNAASRMMEKSNDDVVIEEYQIEFENDWSTRKAGVKEISSIEIKNPNRTYPYPKEIKDVLSNANADFSNYFHIKDDRDKVVVFVELSHTDSWSELGDTHYDYSETANKIIKVLKDNFNLEELGVEKSRERRGWVINKGDHYTEDEEAKYAVTYKDDGIDELDESFDSILDMVKRKTEDFSLRNGFITCDTDEEKDSVVKLLKRYYDDVEAEAEVFNGENYYNVFFADPSWEQSVDESLKESDEHLHQLYKLYWDIVKASKEFDPWYLYDYIFSIIKNKDYADNFKKAVKPLSDDELGEMDSEQVIDHIFDCISGEDYELQFSKDFMSGLWDYFPESLDKKNLKEAHLGPYKYKYEVYWVSPHTGENSLLGASKTYEGAVDIAKRQINEIASSPWENKKNKIKFIQTTTIADADFDFLEDEEELADYKSKVIASLNESLKEYIDSTILSDQTLSMLEEGDHLVDGNEDWQILEIEVRGNRYLPKRERVSLHLIGKNGIKKYTSAGTLYGYKIVEKSGALGENLKEDWEDENHGTSDKKASMKRVEKFVDLVGGDLKSTKDGGAIITWDGGKIVAKGLQDLFNKVEKAYKKMQKSMKEDIDWSKSFATMSDEEIRKEISKMNEKSDKEYLQDYLDYFNAIYKQEDGKHIIELPYDEDIVEDSFEDLMYDVKYNLHEMSLDGSL